MKRVLVSVLTVVLLIALAIPMAIAPVLASPAYVETLYLSDTGNAGDGTSTLYEVVINTTDNRAELTPLPNGVINFNHVDAIACTLDGLLIYCIDDGTYVSCTRHLGVYDVASAKFTDLGLITTDGTTPFLNTDQAAFSTDGILYVTRNEDDKLYTLDTSTRIVSEVGVVKKDGLYPVDIVGADIVFDENDVCYLWIYSNRTDAPQGLYTFPKPTSAGDINATWCSPSASVDFKGMVIRDGGAGDLIGSRTGTGKISVINKTTGVVTSEYPMMTWDGSNWVSFNHSLGDMTVGERAVENPGGQNFVTGGGNIKIEGMNKKGKIIEKVAWTFGGNVGFLESGDIFGQFQIVDHTGKESWHCHNDFDSLIFWGDPTDSPPASVDHAQFVGTFTSNKGDEKYLRVTIWDDQEPGRDYDWITVEVSTDGGANWTTWFSGEPISGGNFQVHNVE